MFFWIASVGLAGLSASVIVLTLLRRQDMPRAAAYDLRVYRDQLVELDRDVARGIVTGAEAERARVEISRRILEADRQYRGAADAPQAPRHWTLAAAGATALAVVAGATLLYLQLGAPGYPDLPLAARISLAEEARAGRPLQADAEESLGPRQPDEELDPQFLALVERLRAVVSERPSDQQGLALLARNEAVVGNFAAAHAAQARLIDVKGEAATARDYADLADLLIQAAGGYVSPEAEAALTESLKRDPTNGAARYYSGLLFAQTGRPDLAFRFWQALLAEGPPDAPWMTPIRGQIEDIAMRAGEVTFRLPPEAAPSPSAPAAGPTQEQVEAAGEMDPAARTEMIRGMVAGLAERLGSEGGPPAEWAQLIRAYAVLGETGRIAPVLAEAREAFADDPEGLAEVEAAARDAGIAE